jgi:type IV pilus assembly protein PilP
MPKPSSPRRRPKAAARLAAGLLAAVLAAACLAGCGKQAAPPAGKPPQAKAQQKAQSAAGAPQGDVYAYSAAGKPDPFRPFGVGRVKEDQPEESGRSLKTMDVGSFKLVGIAESPNGPLALVQDGAGRGYILSPGMTVGPGGAVVKRVGEDGVAVEQRSVDYAGRVQTKTYTIKMVREEE